MLCVTFSFKGSRLHHYVNETHILMSRCATDIMKNGNNIKRMRKVLRRGNLSLVYMVTPSTSCIMQINPE